MKKWQWKFNLLAGLVLAAVLFVGINGLAFKHYYRKNVLVASSYTKIGEQTKNLLAGLAEPLTLVNYVAGGADPVAGLIAPDVELLLEEYADYGKGKVTVRRVDPYNFEEARRVGEEFKLTTQENAVVAVYKGQSRVVNYYELANVEVSQMGARLESFKAEEAVSSAIQALVQGKRSVIYFLCGHGEFDPETADREDFGYSVLTGYLERQNSAVMKWNLAEVPKVPEDADLVICASPKSKYNAYELEALRDYLLRSGRLVVLLNPGTETGLEDFFADYGVVFRKDWVVGKFATLGQTRVLANAIGSIFADHPAVAWLRKSGVTLNLGPMRSLTVSETEKGKGAVITPLVRTPDLFWGETEYKGTDAEFDAAKDFAGPLTVAVAIDTASVGGGQVQLKGMKAVLVGGGDFLINKLMGAEQADFFINLTNWMLEGGKPLGIAPKVPKQFTVTLEPRQEATLTTVLLMFPAAGLVLAGMVWLKRRR